MAKPTCKDIYDAVAHQIEREDNLVNNRVNWFLASQGFLFATVGVIIGSGLKEQVKILAAEAIAVLGFSMGVIILFGVIGAEIALYRLKEHWEEIEGFYGGYFPPPYGKGWACRLGRMPRVFIPSILIGAWVIIFLYIFLNPDCFEIVEPDKIADRVHRHLNLLIR